MKDLLIRKNSIESGFEIVVGGEILDFISMRELLTAEIPHRLMEERVKRVENRLRARRFVRLLEKV